MPEQTAAAPDLCITPRALLETHLLQAPVIHPDGVRVAFTATDTDFHDSSRRSFLWIAEWPLPSGSDVEEELPEPEDLARRITWQRDGAHSPRWSPDGRWLAFLSARPEENGKEEDEEEHTPMRLWVMHMEGGEPFCPCAFTEDVEEYAWEPGSESLIAMLVQPLPKPVAAYRRTQRTDEYIDPVEEPAEKRPRQFWRIDIAARKATLLATADAGALEFALSPEGDRIAWITNHTGEPNDYHLSEIEMLNLKTNVKQKICERPGGKSCLRWSPDGSALAYLSWLQYDLSYSRTSIFLMKTPPHENGMEPPAWLQDFPNACPLEPYTPQDWDHDVQEIEWSKTEGALYAITLEGTGTGLARIAEKTEMLPISADADRCDLCISPESGRMVWVEQSSNSLPELVMRTPEGETRTITALNADFLRKYRLPRQKVVRWKAPDGLEIEGVLTLPDAEGPAPLVLQLHGGPHGRSANTLLSYSMHPAWAAAGYAVLRPNYRGSEGYGNAFGTANRRDLGGGDYQDVMAGVDWCIEQGIALPHKLGVMGGSYGGYLTNWIIGHTSRFAGAVSLFGIFHLQTDYSNSALSRWDNDYLGAYYWEDEEIYRRLSPGTYLQNIQTPTLIVHGQDDDNTTLANSREMYQALRHRGVTTRFVHYPREGHGLQEPNHRLDEMRRCMAWLDRYVLHAGSEPAVLRTGDAQEREGLTLIVTRAETASFTGAEQKEGMALLEVSFTIHSALPYPSTYLLSLDRITLEQEGEHLPAAGTGAEVHGARILIEGSKIYTLQHPHPETGAVGFGFSAVFCVGETKGMGRVHIADFAPVEVCWWGEELESAPDAGEDSAEG